MGAEPRSFVISLLLAAKGGVCSSVLCGSITRSIGNLNTKATTRVSGTDNVAVGERNEPGELLEVTGTEKHKYTNSASLHMNAEPVGG